MRCFNPGDNQGVRYLLIACLLDLGADAEVKRLLARYGGDVAAVWPYARALLTFRAGGADERARASLDKALAANAFVPDYLLGRKRLPEAMPPYIGIGDEPEAISCADDLLEA